MGARNQMAIQQQKYQHPHQHPQKQPRKQQPSGAGGAVSAAQRQRAEQHFAQGRLCAQKGDWSNALAQYRKAYALSPEPLYALQAGRALVALGELTQAIEMAALALQGDSTLLPAYMMQAHALGELKRFGEALELLQNVPDGVRKDHHYWQALAHAAEQCANHELTASALLQALSTQLTDAVLYARLADAFRRLERKAEAAECLRTAIALRHSQPHSMRGLLCLVEAEACDWAALAPDLLAMREGVAQLAPDAAAQTSPWVFSTLVSDPFEQRKASQHYAQFIASAVEPLPSRPARRDGRRLRLGYVSADFNSHATSVLMVEALEHHDRREFEVFLLSNSVPDGTAMRQRVEASSEHFLDVRGMSAPELAQQIRALEIDILIDLKGATDGALLALFALRPAPLQVSWLGFPGTSGASYIDYVIGDPVVTPMAHAAHFTEQIAQMPVCYQPNDSKRHRPVPVTRQQAGLPQGAIVLCAFHQPYKVSEAVFDVWCDILRRLPSAVLWLLEYNDRVRQALCSQALARGIAPDRLIFTPKIPTDLNLDRMACADVFLDTWPCTAHTTASEALWAGLPVVTLVGPAFANRVAASILNAVDLPQLVTHSVEAYRERVIELAQNPRQREDLRHHLAAQRDLSPLFDGARFAGDLEALYQRMWQRAEQGLAPAPLLAADARQNTGQDCWVGMLGRSAGQEC